MVQVLELEEVDVLEKEELTTEELQARLDEKEEIELTQEELQARFDRLRLNIAPLLAEVVQVSTKLHGLTNKQRQILELILDGCSNKQIGEKSGNTEKTIKHHIADIFNKLNLNGRTQIFSFFTGRIP